MRRAFPEKEIPRGPSERIAGEQSLFDRFFAIGADQADGLAQARDLGIGRLFAVKAGFDLFPDELQTLFRTVHFFEFVSEALSNAEKEQTAEVLLNVSVGGVPRRVSEITRHLHGVLCVAVVALQDIHLMDPVFFYFFLAPFGVITGVVLVLDLKAAVVPAFLHFTDFVLPVGLGRVPVGPSRSFIFATASSRAVIRAF